MNYLKMYRNVTKTHIDGHLEAIKLVWLPKQTTPQPARILLVNESTFFFLFEVIQTNTTDISSQMRRSAQLNTNGKLWAFATVEVGGGLLFIYTWLSNSNACDWLHAVIRVAEME